jgi:hypothetical protein
MLSHKKHIDNRQLIMPNRVILADASESVIYRLTPIGSAYISACAG